MVTHTSDRLVDSRRSSMAGVSGRVQMVYACMKDSMFKDSSMVRAGTYGTTRKCMRGNLRKARSKAQVF